MENENFLWRVRRRIINSWRISFIALLLVQFVSCGGLLPSGDGDSPNAGARPAPHFEPGFNLFTPEQDVELGRQSAEQIARQVPILRDEQIVNYVRSVGARLAARAPGHRFPYQFNVVASREINAFALPGGFIFINAGAVMAARNEGELAGVMAHEIMHVALRHGTNQASKAYVAQAGIGIISRILGGGENPDMAQVINAIGGVGANMVFLKFGRTAETQSDLEGARIMAEAGYDPRDMAGFFQTIQSQSRQRAPEFLSDHPDPGNRIAAINGILPNLPISQNPTRDTPQFQQARARLTGGASRSSLTDSADPRRTGPSNPNDNQPGARPAPPSSNMREFASRAGAFQLRFPDNWDALGTNDESNIILAPRGAHGQTAQGVVFVTHGLFVGVLPAQGDLQTATVRFVRQQIEANADFEIVRQPQQVSLGGRPALATVVAGPSTVSGVRETDVIFTAVLSDGRLFYLTTIAPENEMQTYQAVFEQIVASVRFAE